MVKEYFRPAGVEEALELLAVPGSLALAGGTFALAFDARAKPERIVDVALAVPRGIERRGGALRIGAGARFQELIDSEAVPAVLKAAAASMANRNARNRATVGGNLGANKSCASLVPILLVLGASVEYRERGRPSAVVPLAEWLAAPKGLALTLTAPLGSPAAGKPTPGEGLRAASLRASRTACDIATATAACAFVLDAGRVAGLRVAVGGFGPHAALRLDIAALFEGKPLPTKAEIENAVLPLLIAIGDQRGSAEYKRLRGAALVADTLHAAEVIT
ncbi:MAG: hypothetical protein CVV51_09885 [Spirochaetae bacterium HGW-Spirochaetae-7]|nr:MAG: hypothetical protein CVV51_09885 [Spirochaetae bacterium HGW-Spirochaetae-7]